MAGYQLAGWHYLLARCIRLYYDAYRQPAFNHVSNYRVQLDTGIDLSLYRGLAFAFLISYTHENTVIAGVANVDKTLGFVITYHFIKS